MKKSNYFLSTAKNILIFFDDFKLLEAQRPKNIHNKKFLILIGSYPISPISSKSECDLYFHPDIHINSLLIEI